MASHFEFRNGALVEVDNETGAISSTTPLQRMNPFEGDPLTNQDAPNMSAANGIVRNPNPVPISYTPTKCVELRATLELLSHYLSEAASAVSQSEIDRYRKICSVLNARIDEMERNLLYESKEKI